MASAAEKDKKQGELTVTLTPQGVRIPGENGRPSKIISHEEFLERYQNTKPIEENKNKEERFLFPPNTYLFSKTKSTMSVGLYFRERTVPEMQFANRGDRPKKIKNVRLPNIVISCKFKKRKNWGLESFQFFATDRGILDLPDKLITSPAHNQHIWALPLPNMYGGGNMCTGGNSVISSYNEDLRPLITLYKMLTDSPFNNDLSVPSVGSEVRPLPWLESLSGKTEFPYEKLSGFNESLHNELVHNSSLAGEI